MSLHDVDKTSTNRSAPALNVDDSLSAASRMSHSTLGVTLVDEATGTSARVVFVDGKVEVYRSDNTLVGRIGVRASDTEGVVETAKPGSAL